MENTQESKNIVEVEYAMTTGKHLFYPKNDNAQHFVFLKGQRKSFNKEDLQKMKLLGFEIKIIPRQYEIPEGIE